MAENKSAAPAARKTRAVPLTPAPSAKTAADPQPGAKPQAPAGNPSQPPKKGILADLISPVLGQSFDFLKKGYLDYYVGILKINITEVLASIALLLIFGLVFIAGYLGSSYVKLPQMVLVAAAVALYLIFIIIMSWVKHTLNLSAIIFTDSRFSGKEFSIRQTFSAIKGRVLRYFLLDMLMRLVLAIPLVGVLLLAYLTVPPATMTSGFLVTLVLAYVFVLLYSLIVYTIYGFLTQFWAYGFLIDGLGVVASLKRSVSLVKSKPVEAIIFDVLLAIISMVASLPLAAFIVIAYFGLMFSQLIAIPVMMAVPAAGFMVYVAIFLLWILVVGAASVFLSAIVQTVQLPPVLLFWKRLKDW